MRNLTIPEIKIILQQIVKNAAKEKMGEDDAEDALVRWEWKEKRAKDNTVINKLNDLIEWL